MDLPPIAMEDVTRRFGKLVAVRGVSLEIEPGTILGLVGPSGSGKTTIVRMLTGTLRPSAGRMQVLGEAPGRFRAHTRERIGYMPQQFVLYPDLTARENVSFVAALFGMYFRRRSERVREVLEALGLGAARDRLARDLSGGERRRLALAAALVHEPDVLFIDEPTAGIDPLLRSDIWDQLRGLAGSGRTLLVTTQHLDEAERCDAVAVLSDGELLALAEPDVLREHVYGGEILDVRTTRKLDARALGDIPGIRRVRQRGERQFIVVAEDAAAATPRIVEAVQQRAGVVASIERYAPSFDEVFAALVEDHRSKPRAA